MIVKRQLKNGTTKQYSYEKIGNKPVAAYMNEKLKQRRRQERRKKGKILFDEITQSKLKELRTSRNNGASYSRLAKEHGLSYYFVQKALES